VEVVKDDEETKHHVHEKVKNNRQNVEYNSVPGWKVWGAKEKIKIIFWSRNLSDSTQQVKNNGETNKLTDELSVLAYAG
jgi:hypothetical protein